ncbi:dienelactone hydrolase family protein [Litoribacter alkaliphilus]|uniref:Dienelactone hydrolase family protein n=1 Tax=Litoribacter ruber TaxID=702568 RepID=A0AAP2CL11_9BACT|nr:dienelactone hydrolase family protein [Litoribacter alkaliphilus]MBS9523782.1 dienelactone hydrolase family protein [Litoribacter alkaliphilus]
MKKLFLFYAAFFLAAVLYAQDRDLERLENSPRHHEWINMDQDGRNIRGFLVYPEKSDNAKSIIVIHENRGLTDWVRSMADQLAEMGYIALAPDLLSDFDDSKKSTRDFASQDDAREGIYALDNRQVMKDLDTAFEYLKTVDGGNGEVSVIGFCWGGSQTFNYATHQSGISEALVFYGTGPKDIEQIARIEAPVYGFYGGNDQRVNATIENSAEMMEEKGKTFEYEIYEEAGHAYMRSGEGPEASEGNRVAREKSLERIKAILE